MTKGTAAGSTGASENDISVQASYGSHRPSAFPLHDVPPVVCRASHCLIANRTRFVEAPTQTLSLSFDRGVPVMPADERCRSEHHSAIYDMMDGPSALSARAIKPFGRLRACSLYRRMAATKPAAQRSWLSRLSPPVARSKSSIPHRPTTIRSGAELCESPPRGTSL